MEQKGTAVPHPHCFLLLQGEAALPGNHSYLKNWARARSRVRNCELLCAILIIWYNPYSFQRTESADQGDLPGRRPPALAHCRGRVPQPPQSCRGVQLLRLPYTFQIVSFTTKAGSSEANHSHEYPAPLRSKPCICSFIIHFSFNVLHTWETLCESQNERGRKRESSSCL